MFAAIIAAFSGAAEVISDKALLVRKEFTGKTLMVFSLVFVALWMLIPAFLWGSIKPSFFTLFYLALFLLVILVAFGYNYLYFYAISAENVCDLEPIAVLAFPLSAILASIVYPAERSLWTLALTIVAALALVLSRVEKHHLDLNKYSLAMFLDVILVAIEAVLIKQLLNVVSPVALYAIRTSVLAIIMVLVFRPTVKKESQLKLFHVVIIGGITAVEYVARYFSYAQIGVVKSSLIFLLGPVLILLFSKILLKEKITYRRALGDAVIIGCVALTVFIH